MTVGTGANALNFVEAAVENRGLSFSIGGMVLVHISACFVNNLM